MGICATKPNKSIDLLQNNYLPKTCSFGKISSKIFCRSPAAPRPTAVAAQLETSKFIDSDFPQNIIIFDHNYFAKGLMSIDVNYYSFSPSRSDHEWPHFIEDLSVLRKKHSPWNKYQKDTQEFQKKRAEIEANFEPRSAEIRNKIFDFFDKKGYTIPWVEWNAELGTDRHGNPITLTDEDKMEYLKVYGCVYPRGTDLKNKDVPYLMLRKDAPELEEAHDRIINERNESIDKLSKQITIAPMEDKNVILNNRQKKLNDETDLSYLKYENEFNGNQLIFDLKNLDIHYGSVGNKYFEDPKLEYTYLEALIAVYNLQTENNVPKRNEWIRLFQNINNETIQRASVQLAKEFHWGKEESELALKDYLRSVRPVVKDLKEINDSIFIRMYGGEIEVEPKNAESILLERAKKHATKYKGLLPPVL